MLLWNVLRLLSTRYVMTVEQLSQAFDVPTDRIEYVLLKMREVGLVEQMYGRDVSQVWLTLRGLRFRERFLSKGGKAAYYRAAVAHAYAHLSGRLAAPGSIAIEVELSQKGGGDLMARVEGLCCHN